MMKIKLRSLHIHQMQLNWELLCEKNCIILSMIKSDIANLGILATACAQFIDIVKFQTIIKYLKIFYE